MRKKRKPVLLALAIGDYEHLKNNATYYEKSMTQYIVDFLREDNEKITRLKKKSLKNKSEVKYEF